MIIPNLMAYSPNRKLNVAFIGAGGRGGANLRGCDIKTADGVATNNIVALCDVSESRAANAFEKYPNARRFTDFRKMFDAMADEIDAVVVTTPDHTHFPAAMAAMELGKHIYVDKPLAHNIWQLRTLKKAAKHYGIISQMGNQGHTTEGIRFVKEWYEAGVLGEVKEVIAWNNGPHFRETGYFLKPNHFPPSPQEVPKGLDWDSWLGPAEARPYSRYYLPRFWRAWYEFGNAALGDWACHTLDAPFWSLDLGMPTSVESVFKSSSVEGFVPNHSHLEFNFPARGNKPPVRMHWYEGGLKPANRPEWGLEELLWFRHDHGGQQMLTGHRRTSQIRPKLLVSEEEWTAFQKNMPEKTIPRIAEEDPQGEWIRAIKEEGSHAGIKF